MRFQFLLLSSLTLSFCAFADHPENLWIKNRLALIQDLREYLEEIQQTQPIEEILPEIKLAINFLEPLARTKSPYSAKAADLLQNCESYLQNNHL